MPLAERWNAWWKAPGQSRGAGGLLAVVMALMAVAVLYLIFGDKPWTYASEIEALKEKGKKLDLRHHVAAGLFYASIINLVLGAAVLLTRGWLVGLR